MTLGIGLGLDKANFVGQGNSFDPLVTAYFAQWTANGYALPSEAAQTLLNNLVLAQKTFIQKFDRFYLFSDTSNAGSMLISLVNPTSTKRTNYSSVANTAKVGWKGDGASAYLGWNFTPTSDAVNMSQNSATLLFYVEANPTIGSYTISAADGTNIIVRVTNATNQRLNTTNNLASPYSFSGASLKAFIRQDATNLEFINATTTVSRTATSTGMPNSEVTTFRSTALYSDTTLALEAIGEAITYAEEQAFRTDWLTYYNAIKAL